MAFVEETRKSEVDALLAQSKVRNPEIRIQADRDEDFKDPSLFLRDDATGGLIIFSIRLGLDGSPAFWEGSFGTFSNDTRALYSVAYIQDFFQKGFDWATRFGSLPFSAAYPLESCPWLMELTNDQRDFTVADNVMTAINNIQRNTMVRLSPPQRIVVPVPGGERDLGTVVVHSVPLRVDVRGL